jgi:cobalamin biosynthesis protein CobT
MKKTFKKIKKHDTIYHPQTNFVCKSREDKRIIGKLNEDQEILQLDDSDSTLLAEWEFVAYESENEEGEEEHKDSDNEQEAENTSEEQEAEAENTSEEQETENVSEEQEAETENAGEEQEAEAEAENTGEEQEAENTSEEQESKNDMSSVKKDLYNGIDLLYNRLLHNEKLLNNKKMEYEDLEKRYNILHQKFEKMKIFFDS